MANPLYESLFGKHAGAETPFLYLPDGQTLTHARFLARAAQLAGAMQDLAPGDRVAVQVDKSAEALALYAACVQAGLIFLPLNTGYTAAELAYFIENSGARLVVCAPSKLAAVQAISGGARVETMDAAGKGSLGTQADAMPPSFETAARGGDDLAAFLYTSGTTGRSKGAMLTQNNLLSNAQVLVDHWRFTRADVLLHALPIFHTHGLFVATNVMLACGGAMIFEPAFDLDRMIAGLPRATTLMGVPTFYTRLLSDDRFTGDLVGHMRLFISGSAPLLAETHTQFETRTGHRILERYGMTETNMSTSNPYDGARRAGTVGPALPGVALKVMAEGVEAPVGEIGTIEVRGPNVFKGYWQMPEKTKAELRPDGWFITGDLGFVDSDGYVTIVGRDKDLIISGGYNIYPKEVELILDDVDGVLESAVIGLPHPDFGESPFAVLVASGAVDMDAVRSAVANALARFKHPKGYAVVEALPRNTMGKVQKNVLREQYQTQFTPE